MESFIQKKLPLFYFVLSTNYAVVYEKPDSRLASDTTEDVAKGVVALERPSIAEYPTNVFPEYAERSLRSLLWELSSVVPDTEKQAITKAYEFSRKLQLLYIFAKKRQVKDDTPGGLVGASLTAIKEKINQAVSRLTYGEVRDALNLERWGKPFGETKQ